jgi:hypothetical protein
MEFHVDIYAPNKEEDLKKKTSLDSGVMHHNGHKEDYLQLEIILLLMVIGVLCWM